MTDVDAALATLFSDWAPDEPGGVAAVLHGDRVVARRAFGLASLEHAIPNTLSGRFHIASVTKTFVGAALAMLAHQGRLDLDADARAIIPELAVPGPITLRRLAGMTAGLRDAMEMMKLRGVWYRYPRSEADLTALALAQTEPSYPAGERYVYTNIQFNLCALAIARTVGKPFSAAVDELIFTPLGMTRTLIRDDPETMTDGLANPYIKDAGGWRRGAWAFGVSGAGGLVSDLDDLIRWNLALRDGSVNGVPIVAMTERGTLADGTPTNYGLGLGIRTWRGLTVWVHGGSLPGYKANFARVPARDLGFVLLSNREDADPYARLRRLLELTLGESVPAPPVPDTGLDAATLKALDGTFVDAISGEPLTLTRTESGLTGDKLGFALSLAPQGKGVFRDGWANADTIVRVESGPRLHVDFGGQRGVYLPANPPTLTDADRAAYAGRYVCPALATEHTVFERDGGLVVRFGPAYHEEAELPLAPLAADTFHGKTGRPGWVSQHVLRFTRAGGVVAGYRISSDRLKDVAFVRVV
ncbi:serine hydrolase domain-containing protein [Elioraea tepidiphila]|uniref:serine hydrolase domain-containing protein n=1 Tax=Elioraea tepidiphila TaxID=457934 RepID=UPI000363931F|nr:serine hydrolase domain-containing protein [Elioraea tepidiphila]